MSQQKPERQRGLAHSPLGPPPCQRKGEVAPAMKINPRCYPYIILAAYAIFLLLGILLGFGPERGGEHGLLLAMEACA